MENVKAKIADDMHNRKYNCCQSVACAFADELGVDMQTLFKAGEGFGFGMGGMQGICGALSGACIVAGFYSSDGDLEDPKTKKHTTALALEMSKRFQEKTGALICRDLKGADTGVVLCTCPNCIKAGVEVVQEVLGL